MKLFVVTLGLLSLSGGALAQATNDMARMNAAEHSAMAPAGAQGTGVIKKLDAKAGSVTLQHGPIAALKWPAMTMAFKADPGLLKGFKVGQKVTFTVAPGETPQVIAIKDAG